MYELLATAVAGIHAGAGLHAALAGAPASEPTAGAAYHSKTRRLGLLLSLISSGAAAAAFHSGEHAARLLRRSCLWGRARLTHQQLLPALQRV